MTGPLSSDQRAALQNAIVLLKQSQARLAAVEAQQHEPIAIVGMGCRFPSADSPAEFWQLLRCGGEGVREVPADRFELDCYFDPDPAAAGKIYTRWGGFLNRVDQFDADFFGISPREAIRMDPQQRLLAEVAWEALEDAGLAPLRIGGMQAGVYIGMMLSEYAVLQCGDPANFDMFSGTGSANAIAANRLSYMLDLRGPSLAIDTACSSSLVAVHMACQSLRRREVDLALAGGVNLLLRPEMTIALCRAQMMSPEGRCKTFDASADGYVRGEGCGVIVLKRLSEAQRDGDRILALIRGSAVNHDGRSNGITAPSGLAQQAVLRAALEDARLSPLDISYVEAHGTGTRLGDPIETEALLEVLAQQRPADNPLTIGSVKTNIGHLEAAAGIAGLIKSVLMLRHRHLVPHRNLRELNPFLKLEGQPVRIATQLEVWQGGEQPLRAGTSSFGFGGTNAHVVLEESPPNPIHIDRLQRPLHILTLSARSPEALQQLATRYAAHFDQRAEDSAADCAFTANTGRVHFAHRLALLGSSLSEWQTQLTAFVRDSAATGCVTGHASAGHRVAMLFTGQGAQYAGMSRVLYGTQPVFRAALDQCAEILAQYLDRPLLELFDPRAGKLLDETGYTQPTMFSLGYALATLWRSWGVEPAAVMGHSVGEFTAACLAGVLSLEDALRLIATRARLMQQLPPGGMMAAVFAGAPRVAAAIADLPQRVAIAALNGPRNTVISGCEADVQAVLVQLAEQGVQSKPLATSHAFHSPLIEPMLEDLVDAAESLTFSAPQLPLVSNLTGRPADATTYADPEYWARHAREPVQFATGMQTLADLGCNIFLEIGPHPTLIGMGQRCLTQDDYSWLPTLRAGRDDWQTILGSLARLYIRGVPIDWRGFDQAYHRRRLALPSYPFQRRRYWLESPGAASTPAPHGVATSQAAHPLAGPQLPLPLEDKVFQSPLPASPPKLLDDFRVSSRRLVPAAVWLEMALGAAATLRPDVPLTASELSLPPPLSWDELTPPLQTVLSPDGHGGYRFRVVAASAREQASPDFSTLCAGRLEPSATEAASADLPLSVAELQTSFEGLAFDGAAVPAAFEQADVQLGQGFQWIVRFRPADGESWAELRPPTSTDQLDRYRLHPGLLEACGQILATAAHGESPAGDVTVVREIRSLRVFAAPHGTSWCHARIQQQDEQRITGDITLVDEAGRVLLSADGVQLLRVPRDWYARRLEASPDHWLHELAWTPRARDPLPAVPAAQRWLLLDTSGDFAGGLAHQLEARGQSVEMVRVSGSPEDVRRQVEQLLRPGTDAGHETAAGSMWRAVVDLRGVRACPAGDDVDFGRAEQHGWGGVLDLVQAIGAAALTQPPQLVVVTRGAVSVPGSEHPLAVDASPTWGLVRVAATEHPELAPRLIDLDPQSGSDETRALAEELLDERRSEQVALRRGQRYVARVRPVALTRERAASTLSASNTLSAPDWLAWQRSLLRLRPDVDYLVTGGLGGLGLPLARWLALRGARHVTLVGRSQPTAAAQELLDELRSGGVQIVWRPCDISQRDQVAHLLESLRGSGRRLGGVFHLAGVLDDGVLGKQTRERFQRVLAAKARGAWHLHELTTHERLDYFVMFSSAAAVLGAPGQSNYAAANALLDALAWHRRALGHPAISINWGAWSEAGMAARLDSAEAGRLASAGLRSIPVAQGFALLESILAASPTQIGVLPVDWQSFLERIPAGAEPPWLAELAAEYRTEKRASSSESSAWLAQVRGLRAAEQYDAVLQHLREAAARILGGSASELPDPRRPLNQLGFDSLMGVEFCNGLSRSLGRTLDATLLFDYSTLEKLATYITSEVLASEGPAAASDSSREPLAEPALDAVQQQVLAEVRELDEDDIESLIHEQLERLRG